MKTNSRWSYLLIILHTFWLIELPIRGAFKKHPCLSPIFYHTEAIYMESTALVSNSTIKSRCGLASLQNRHLYSLACNCGSISSWWYTMMYNWYLILNKKKILRILLDYKLANKLKLIVFNETSFSHNHGEIYASWFRGYKSNKNLSHGALK